MDLAEKFQTKKHQLATYPSGKRKLNCDPLRRRKSAISKGKSAIPSYPGPNTRQFRLAAFGDLSDPSTLPSWRIRIPRAHILTGFGRLWQVAVRVVLHCYNRVWNPFQDCQNIMGVIQYRRGERFDRVIVSKNEDPRASTMIVRLNTHSFKVPESQTRAAVAPVAAAKPSTAPMPEDRSLAAVLKRAVEAAAQQSNDATTREVFKPAVDAANRSRDEAQKIWTEVSNKSKEGVKTNPLKLFIIGFIAFQVLRAIFN